MALERLTKHTELEKTNLQSITLPENQRSLAYVQAVLKHNLSPSKVSDLVNGLRGMQAEIRACLEELENLFGHVNDLYNITKDSLVRVARPASLFSTSTALTARVKLAGWLKRREGTWGFSSRNRPTTVRPVTFREVP